MTFAKDTAEYAILTRLKEAGGTMEASKVGDAGFIQWMGRQRLVGFTEAVEARPSIVTILQTGIDAILKADAADEARKERQADLLESVNFPDCDYGDVEAVYTSPSNADLMREIKRMRGLLEYHFGVK